MSFVVKDAVNGKEFRCSVCPKTYFISNASWFLKRHADTPKHQENIATANSSAAAGFKQIFKLANTKSRETKRAELAFAGCIAQHVAIRSKKFYKYMYIV